MEVIRREVMPSRPREFPVVWYRKRDSLILGSCLRLRRLRQPEASAYTRVFGSCIMAQMKPTSSRATAAITSGLDFCRAHSRR